MLITCPKCGEENCLSTFGTDLRPQFDLCPRCGFDFDPTWGRAGDSVAPPKCPDFFLLDDPPYDPADVFGRP